MLKWTLLIGGALTAVPATAYASGSPGSAAVSASDNAQIGDIVVTAQRRSESAQKVPISVAVLSADSVAPGRAASSEDISKQVVGLQFNNTYAAVNPTIFIRGVGVNDYNPAAAGTVGIVVDDVYFNNGLGSMFALYDVDRIEVLRGPQGTLFGKNTTGGVLNFAIKKPSFDRSIDATATYGRFNQADAQLAIGGG